MLFRSKEKAIANSLRNRLIWDGINEEYKDIDEDIDEDIVLIDDSVTKVYKYEYDKILEKYNESKSKGHKLIKMILKKNRKIDELNYEVKVISDFCNETEV